MRAWPAATAVIVAGMAATAMAQNAPAFPSSLEREPLLAWLQRETDIQPDRVVAVTPQALTAVVSTFTGGGAGGAPRVVIRAEALNGETYARTGALSWHVSLTADCAARRVRLGETTGYPQRNLLGERKVLRPAEADWRPTEPGTALDNAWRAVCDSSFHGPFQTAGTKIAQSEAGAAPPPAALSTPAPAPAPAPVREAKPTPKPSAPPKAMLQPAPAVVAGGAYSVQVGAFPDAAAARSVLDRLAAGRPHSVETAVVNGRTWNRAVISGFGSAADAARFCDGVQAKGGACLVRGGVR